MSLRFDQTFHELLVGSYQRFFGHSLVLYGPNAEHSAWWLYVTDPSAILAHNAAPDPISIYRNKDAQQLFEYWWDELVALPSRLSAEAPERGERQRFLERVNRDGLLRAIPASGLRSQEHASELRTRPYSNWWMNMATIMSRLQGFHNGSPFDKHQDITFWASPPGCHV
jgi:hypothetical protein